MTEEEFRRRVEYRQVDIMECDAETRADLYSMLNPQLEPDKLDVASKIDTLNVGSKIDVIILNDPYVEEWTCILCIDAYQITHDSCTGRVNDKAVKRVATRWLIDNKYKDLLLERKRLHSL